MNQTIERATFGDRTATSEVVESLRPRLERMAAYYARRCGEDTDDLLQEAWLGVLEAIPGLDLRIGCPEQHLIKRARWRLLDAIRRQRVRRCQSLDGELERDPGLEPACQAVDGANVDEFKSQLTSTQRRIVECLLEGLTWRETGSVLGCTSANVAYYMRQIRRRYEDWDPEAVGV